MANSAVYTRAVKVTLHDFITRLSELVPDDAIFLGDAGSAMFATAQAIKIRGTQRLLLSGGQSCMGWALPAAIGASFATGRHVYAISGDGSVQMNIQELQTLKHHHRPVKLFVPNNGGYMCIKSTQDRLCGSRWIGISTGTGMSLPDTGKLAAAYGLPFRRIFRLSDLPSALDISGPAVCEVML